MKTAIALMLIFYGTSNISYASGKQEFLIVHILHGSKPKAPNQSRTIGGMLGGHVVMQIDSFLYGFNFRGRRIHIFPKKGKRNEGIYEKQAASDLRFYSNYKITSIYIPISADQKKQVLEDLEKSVIKSPHDYAFFGMRCASTTYLYLSKVGFFPKSNYFISIIRAFHPKALKNNMLKRVSKKNITVITKPGSPNRKWEGDRIRKIRVCF